jgi:hypothetical protein
MGLFDFGNNPNDYLTTSAKEFKNIALPDLEQMKLQLQEYVSQGILTPEEAEAELLNSNAYDSMDLDSQGKEAQLAALRSLEEIGNEGGLTASDKAKLQAIKNEEQTAARGSREAILQNAAARGVGGSGLELMAQLQNDQDSATRASSRDLNVAAQAQERALQALQSAGQLGGNINQQQFGQQSQIADSKNEIAKFNAANKQNVNMTNVAANNQAQATNLQNRQNISNANVDQQNKQQQYNKELGQQGFQNQMQKAAGQAGIAQSQANQAAQDEQGNKNLIGTGIGAVATLFSDERVKEDVAPFDASKFLDDLTGYTYNYKDKSMGKGKQVGVMAQSIEKEVPQMVEDTPRGKKVDYSPEKIGGPILASLAHINDRLKKIEGK